MMAYKKTTWVDNGPPGISAPYLNNLETQYDEVKTELQKTDGTSDIKPQAVNVQIQDVAGHFVSANVEDALAELVGTVQDGKSAIASSLTAMNQPATSAETHAQLAAKIRDISKDATAATGDVLTGKTFYQGGTKKTGSFAPGPVVSLNYELAFPYNVSCYNEESRTVLTFSGILDGTYVYKVSCYQAYGSRIVTVYSSVRVNGVQKASASGRPGSSPVTFSSSPFTASSTDTIEVRVAVDEGKDEKITFTESIFVKT